MAHFKPRTPEWLFICEKKHFRELTQDECARHGFPDLGAKAIACTWMENQETGDKGVLKRTNAYSVAWDLLAARLGAKLELPVPQAVVFPEPVEACPFHAPSYQGYASYIFSPALGTNPAIITAPHTFQPEAFSASCETFISENMPFAVFMTSGDWEHYNMIHAARIPLAHPICYSIDFEELHLMALSVSPKLAKTVRENSIFAGFDVLHFCGAPFAESAAKATLEKIGRLADSVLKEAAQEIVETLPILAQDPCFPDPGALADALKTSRAGTPSVPGLAALFTPRAIAAYAKKHKVALT